MPTNGQTEARKLRGRLNHPIIDADGHPFGDRIIPAAILFDQESAARNGCFRRHLLLTHEVKPSAV